MKAQILQEENGTRRRVGTGTLNLGSTAILKKGDRLSQKAFESLGDWSQSECRFWSGALWAAKMGGQDKGLTALLKTVPQGRQRSLDSRQIGDVTLLVLGDIVIRAHENTLSREIYVGNGELR
eukprot:XP_001706999.1 Hypothetical protein GL50803_34344 [Giardia lamblia ATCC 50803]